MPKDAKGHGSNSRSARGGIVPSSAAKAAGKRALGFAKPKNSPKTGAGQSYKAEQRRLETAYMNAPRGKKQDAAKAALHAHYDKFKG